MSRVLGRLRCSYPIPGLTRRGKSAIVADDGTGNLQTGASLASLGSSATPSVSELVSLPSSPVVLQEQHDACELEGRETQLSTTQTVTRLEQVERASSLPAVVIKLPIRKTRRRRRRRLDGLPYELLDAILRYLVGDPTRGDFVSYRSAGNASRYFAYSWSLECVSRVNRTMRVAAWPLLVGTLGVVDKDDVRLLAKMPSHHRVLVRHLSLSITALERLYVFLSVLAADGTRSPNDLEVFTGVHDVRPLTLHDGRSALQGRLLSGFPALRSVIFFRPEGSTLSGDAVLPGFAAFFRSVVATLGSSVERLELRDPHGRWMTLDPEGPTVVFGRLASLRCLEWDSAIAFVMVTPSLHSLSVGSSNAQPEGSSVLQELRQFHTDMQATQFSQNLTVLHVKPPHGFNAEQLDALCNKLRPLDRLCDFRVKFAVDIRVDHLLTVLPRSLLILELQEAFPATNTVVALSSNLRRAFSMPDLAATTSALAQLPQLRVLALGDVKGGHRRTCTSSSVCRLSPTAATSSASLASSASSQSRSFERRVHEWHYPTAFDLLRTLSSLREVQFLDPATRLGTCGITDCIWGRPPWDAGELGEVEWVDYGARTRLWETA